MHPKCNEEQIVDKTSKTIFSLAHQVADFLSRIPIRGSLYMGQMLSRIMLGKVKAATIIKTRYGFDMLVSPHQDLGIDRTLFLTGTTERGTLHVMKQYLKHKPESVMFDVGANIGLMSLYASSILPSGMIYSFEPVPETFNKLVFNIELNNKTNIQAFNFALGAKEEEKNIYVNAAHLGMSTFVPSGQPETTAQIVKLLTIDNFIKTRGLKVDFIKIDVEGWEVEVLKGASDLLKKQDAPAIMLEYCKGRTMPPGDDSSIWELIKEFNDYHIFILKNGEHRVGKLIEVTHYEDLPEFTNLFCFLQSHVQRMPKYIFQE